jgi:hypothetical protein
MPLELRVSNKEPLNEEVQVFETQDGLFGN